MSVEHLGAPLTGVYAIPGGQARLHAQGLTISGADGEATVSFAFPSLGRPRIITGDPAATPLFEAGAVTVHAGRLQPDQLTPLIQGALDGRLALLPTGQSPAPLPLTLSQGQLVMAERSGAGAPAAVGMVLSAPALQERQLYDVAVRTDGGAWQVIAPHAIYRRESWVDFGIAHITDIHVARRIDSFRPILRQAGRHDAAARMYNWNDRFRGFVKYANYLYRSGVLDLILATGDLVDYLFEDDDDPNGGGNAAFMRQLILGQAPGPDFPDVEELLVPIFMVPGNHDYRKHAYKLICDLHLGGDILGKDIQRIKNFYGYHMRQDDALLLTNRLDGRSGSAVPNVGINGAARMIEVDPTIAAYRRFLAESGSYVVRLGDHRIIMLDTAHDVGMVTDIWDGLRKLLGMLSEDEATFVGGSPNSEGISADELQLATNALVEAPDSGLVIVGLHAPLFNVWNSEYPYFLRESQRPAQQNQVHGFLARQDGAPLPPPVEEQVKRRHPTWFPGERDHRAPRFVKRGDSQDRLDFGVARGRAEELMRLLAGVQARRPADVVLAGHIHRYNEFRVRTDHNGELVYSMDFYTQNPARYYPTRFTGAWVSASQGYMPASDVTYIEVVPGAAPDATPWPMPYATMYRNQLQVPPYPNPLSTAPDPRAWWAGHRPLVLQTGALGALDNSQVSFSGFRLLMVKNNTIEKIHFISTDRLEASNYRLPFEEAIRPDPPRRHRYLERSRPHKAPAAVGAPAGIVFAAIGATSVIYRDREGRLHELWQQGAETGTSNLTALANNATRAAGDPKVYIDTAGGYEIVLYRGTDGHVHSLYWSTGGVGHDPLSAAAGAPKAAGSPAGYLALDGFHHVIYRAQNGHLYALWWTGPNRPGYDNLTAPVRAPAAGDPAPYINTRNGEHIVAYRGTDGHIHIVYWSTGAVGHDNLSGYARAPRAAGDPSAYYTAHNDAHQVIYRGIDGHIHELWWNTPNPVSHWDLTVAASGAPLAASDPVGYYSAGTNTKHVFYRGTDGHLHEIWWVPGGGIPAHIDLTLYALAPLAADKPAAFNVAGPNSQHVVYRGADGSIHEIRWS